MKTSFGSKGKEILVGVFVTLTLAACGQSPSSIIKNAEVHATVGEDGDIFASLMTSMDSNNIQILPTEIVVMNPKNSSEQIGSLRVTTPQVGMTQITLEVNVSTLAQIQNTLTPETALPNGTPLPVLGTKIGTWYSIRLKQYTNSKLYVNIDNTASVVLGYALVTDQLGAGVAGSIFVPFTGQGVSGYGGVFSGTTPGTSGVAVFADVSGVFSTILPKVKNKVTQNRVILADQTPQSYQEKIYKKLIKLNLKEEKLKFK